MMFTTVFRMLNIFGCNIEIWITFWDILFFTMYLLIIKLMIIVKLDITFHREIYDFSNGATNKLPRTARVYAVAFKDRL